ncbi:DarT ssDNA thymidine ADP-ribosyltransferase family protein [Thermogemmatispora sp.]|uniref:DarT ssDNA thymidine ADP-ribosyltransferase family protein n=1 Tax=Thermogemmatispora sp. TaxID=1968838 RepID=UPI0035E40200
METIVPSGSTEKNNNWDKVSLSFTPYTPMAYHVKRRRHLCYLCISPEVAALQGVIFTDTNANSKLPDALLPGPARQGSGLERAEAALWACLSPLSGHRVQHTN